MTKLPRLLALTLTLALAACGGATPTAAAPAASGLAPVATKPAAAATPTTADATPTAPAATPAATKPAATSTLRPVGTPSPTQASTPATAPAQTTPASTPATKPAEPTKPAAPTAAPAKSAATASFRVETVAGGLDTPWAIAFAPDGRMLVTERPGRVRVIQDGQLRQEPWATFDVFEQNGSEAGLLGIAIDPSFAQNRYVYVAYTYSAGAGLRNRLVRLRDDPAAGRGAVDTVLVDDAPGGRNHDGGSLQFGPDGKLYWALGETGTPALAQDRSSLGGKILRFNPDGSIPSNNPFPNSPVFALGLRNPQGLAWQPGTGRLYAMDHGPSGGQGCCRDELNLIEPGQNYGWPEIRGGQTAPELVEPIVHSGDSNTWAPSGATFATSGPWQGSLLFTALRGQALYRVTLNPNDPRNVTNVQALLQGQYGRLRSVTQGPDGIYVMTSNRDGRGNPAPEDDRVLRLTFGG